MEVWQVMRHGGRHSDQVRVVLSTADEQKARARYGALRDKLRQGWVQIVDPAGKQVDYCWAPRHRLRSSW